MTSAGEVARRQAQVAEMYRRVRASVERNQPLYDSFCSGSLPEVELTEEQRAIIAFFPHQLHELEELRLGRMPSQSLPRATPQPSPAGHGGANNSNNNTPNPPAPRRRRAASTHSSEAASDSDAFPSIDITATTPIEEVVEALVARYAVLEDASPSKRRRVQQEADELLERFIEARSADAAEEVDTAEKALKAANDVKKKLMSGSKQPSKQQAAMIEQLPQLRKRATVAKRKKQKEEELLRERVLAEVAEIAKDADDDANVDEELAELDEVDEEAAVAPAEDGAQKSAAAEEVEAAVHDSAASAEVQASTEDEGYSNPMTHSPDPTTTSATLPEAEADAEEQEQEKEEEKHVLDEPTVHEADATAEPSDSNAATSSLEKDDAGSPLDLPVSPQSTRGAESVGSGHGTSNSRASTPTAIHPLKYRPDSGEPFTLSTFKAMIQPPVVVATATPTPASAAAAAAAQEEKKEGAVVPPTPALPEEAEVEPCARLGAELAALMEDPVPGVGIHCTRNYPPDHVQLLAQWHLLVSPRDGPFAGLPIPLTVAFPVRYPHLAPQVHVWVPMPHSALMVSEQGQKNSIFLSYAPPRRAVATTTTATTAKSGAPRPKKSSAKENGEWHVDLGARDVLVALQDIFNDASFSPMRRAIGHTSFDEQIHAARVAIARCCGGPGGACRAKTAHWPHAASPSLMNGPFVGMASVADDETEEGRRAGRLLNGHAREGRLAGPWKGTWLYVLRPSSVAEAEAIVVDGGAITSGGGGGADPLDDVQLPALYLHMEDHHANTTEGEEAEARPVVSLVPLSATQLEADAQARSSRGSASPIPQWVGSTLHKKESDAQPLWELPASAWSNSEAHVRVVRHNATNTPSTEDASTTTVPLVDREDEAAEAAAFAVVVDVPAGHQLRITFSTTSSCVPSSSSAVGIDAPRLTKEFVQRMWPEAYDLLDPDAAYHANSARNTGLVVELPYGFEGGSSLSEGSLPTRLIKAFGVMEAASYFVPRRVAFSWARGTLPLAMTNTRFESLRATMRRFRPAKAGTIADNFIAHGADDLARRLSREEVEAHPITTPAALLSASTELFWGPRAVFIPMLHLEGNGDAASPKDLPDDCRETLQRFLRTCTQLYRHPTASVAYCPPTRPSAVLHFLALVAQTVLKQHNKSEGEGLGRAYLGSVLEHVLALLTMLAKMVPALHKHLVAVLRTYVRTEGATLLFQDHLWLDGERPSLSHTGKDLLSRVAMLMGGTTDAAARYLMELHILGHLLAAAVVECVAPTDAEDDAELPPTTEELLSSLQQHPCPVDAQPSPTSLLEAWKTLRNTRA